MAEENTAPVAAAPAPEIAESIADKMARHGWDKDVPHSDNPNALGAVARREAGEPSEPEKPEPVPAEDDGEGEPTKVEGKKKTAEKPKAEDAAVAERTELLNKIKALGYEIEDTRVTVAERHALRAERRELFDKVKQIETEAMARIQAATKKAEEERAKEAPRFDKLTAFERAVADGDLEAVAKASGFESYDKMQEHFIALKADPTYKHLLSVREKADALERGIKEREEREAKAAEERTQREQQEAEQRANNEARQNYIAGLKTKMASSSDPLIKAMHDDQSFVGAVFRVMQEQYRETGREITVEEAIRIPMKGTPAPLMAELKRLHERLDPIFRAPAAAPPAAAPKVARTPSPTRAPAPAQTKMNEHEWKQNATRRLEQAAAEDKARSRANGVR